MPLLQDARFSADRTYRYGLRRIWDAALPSLLMIGLNPSTADERRDDPTIRRCVGFARDWGYGTLVVANLFAYRATDPRQLRRAVDPVGPRNDYWLRRYAAAADLVVAAWGNHAALLRRDRAVRALLPALHCIRRNRSGQPAHPLYLPARLRPQPLPE
jgi:hypothetical protein